jgi:protease-4
MSTNQNRQTRGCLLAGAVLLALMMVAVVAVWLLVRTFQSSAPRVARDTVLEIDFGAVVADGPSQVDMGPFFTQRALSLWELTRAIDRARDDDRIAGIRLLGGTGAIGWAGAEEVLTALDRFRAADKPVFAHLEADFIDDHGYFLATGADRIWLSPLTASAINGLAAEAHFYRGTFDKLHIEPQVFMLKEYKSAGESFSNYEMSPWMRESLAALLEGTQERFIERVASERAVPEAALRSFFEQGMAPATDLLELGLVDALGYADEVDDAFAARTGRPYVGIGAADYVATAGAARPGSGPLVALIFAQGPVVTSAPAPLLPLLQQQVLAGDHIAATIREAADDDRVRAIVLRIDSPGGSAVGSDLVRRAIERAQERDKIVVASLADTAASGGYWAAMAADVIVAQPTTMTGSIGVVFSKLDLDGFFEWIGTRVERVTSSPAADMLSTGPLDAREQEGVLSWMNATYATFTAHVATSRGLTPEHVEEIARGRVWTGRHALEHGLVDRLGGIDEAIRVAARGADLDPEREPALLVLPRPRSFWQQVVEGGVSSAPTALSDDALTWLRAVAAPQVQARAPDIHLR